MNKVITSRVYKSCAINILERKLFVDLVVLDIHDFDVMLGWIGSRPIMPRLTATIRL